MAVLRSAFSKDIDDRTMEVWYGSALERCSVDVARETVARIINEDQFFPTPARFNEVRRAVERAQEPTYAALPPAPQTPNQHDRIKAHIANARELIANAKTPRRSA